MKGHNYDADRQEGETPVELFFNKPTHHRKKPTKDSPAHSTVYAIAFITVCTKDRIP
jgi:hypothetical protein